MMQINFIIENACFVCQLLYFIIINYIRKLCISIIISCVLITTIKFYSYDAC